MEIGKPRLLVGSKKRVSNTITRLSVKLLPTCGSVLFIDTINHINPYHPAFALPNQREIFERIWCVRTPTPYDLYARLRTAGKFIHKNQIYGMLVNFLEEEEDKHITQAILKQLSEMTLNHSLTTIVGVPTIFSSLQPYIHEWRVEGDGTYSTGYAVDHL